MKNPYKTNEYKDKFTFEQAVELMITLDSIRVTHPITFGSNQNIDQVLHISGMIPMMLSDTTNKSLRNGTKEQFEYMFKCKADEFDPKHILLNDKGKYLYDNHDEHDMYFESPITPLYLAIDYDRKEFMFQYGYNVCIFGDITGSLYFIRLE